MRRSNFGALRAFDRASCPWPVRRRALAGSCNCASISRSHSASCVPQKSKASSACLSANRCSARQLPCRLAAISSALAWMRTSHQRSQRMAVALAGHDGAQDALARLAGHVGNDVGQLDVHLHQRLLHVLHAARLAAQDASRAGERARAARTHRSPGRKAPRSSP